VAIARVKRPTIDVIEVRDRQMEEKGGESGSGRLRGGKPAGWDEKF